MVMQGDDKGRIKVVFSDNGLDIAVTGEKIEEDDFFITIQGRTKIYKIGKKAIVRIESYSNGGSY